MKKIILTLFTLALITSCKEDKVEEKPDGFIRKTMLTFWADDIIIPGYTDFVVKTSKLKATVKNFTENPTNESLEQARESWKQTYITWQKVSLFQIGKAQELGLTPNVNSYPTNVEELTTKVDKGIYNLESPASYAVQGLPAVDYLLNGVKGATDDEKIVQVYKADEKYKKYLNDIVERLNVLATAVKDDWKGEYRSKFIANDGNTTTSSVDKMVNYFVIPFYEKQLREYKVTIPTGIRNDDKALPKKVEAYYYRKFSKKLYTTALSSTINFFNGTSYDGTKKGQSLQQYLEFLNRKDLADLINKNLGKISSFNNKLDDDFTVQVSSSEKRVVMLDLFDAIQVVLKNFKPDMLSALGITNTSTDADND